MVDGESGEICRWCESCDNFLLPRCPENEESECMLDPAKCHHCDKLSDDADGIPCAGCGRLTGAPLVYRDAVIVHTVIVPSLLERVKILFGANINAHVHVETENLVGELKPAIIIAHTPSWQFWRRWFPRQGYAESPRPEPPPEPDCDHEMTCLKCDEKKAFCEHLLGCGKYCYEPEAAARPDRYLR